MKSKNIILKNCLHCKEEFVVARSDQKFCSTSHRSANFAMLKRSNLIKPLAGIKTLMPEMVIIKDEPAKNQFLKDVGSSSIPVALNEAIKTMRGINDNDQMKLLVEIKNNQVRLLYEISLNNNLIIALNEQLKVSNNKPSSSIYLGN